MKIYISNLGMPSAWLPPKLLLIMKLIVIILITCLMQVSAHSVAQKLTYVKSSATIKEIFKEITKQTGYEVLYANKVVNDLKKINADFKSTPLKEVLDKCLEKQNLVYSLDESKGVVIKEKESSFLDRLAGRWAAIDVRGRVLDEQGNLLPNASIRVKGKNAVTNTNEKGEFLIKDVADDAVLVISYIGYKQLEIPVKGAVMPLEIKLNVATGELEEVKVVYNTGYQKIEPGKATGSFVQIDNELYNRVVSPNILDRILNVTNGLMMWKDANGNNRTNIRGLSTIEGNTTPLIVVDNFPYDGNLNNLNPNDIENVTVLKDAAAAAIWGARAGNGVIVITTKKGGFNRPTNISINSNVTLVTKPDLFYIPSMSSKDVLEFEKKRFADSLYNRFDDRSPSSGSFPPLSQGVEILLAARKKNKGTANYNAFNDPEVIRQLQLLEEIDSRDEINRHLLQTSILQQYAMNISGGGNNYKYFGSAGYDQNRAYDIGNSSRRLTLRLNNVWKPLKNLEINAEINYSQNKSKSGGISYTGYLPGSGQRTPYTRLGDEQGNPLSIPQSYRLAYVDTATYPALLDWHYRPLDERKFTNSTSTISSSLLNFGVNYQIINGLSASAQYMYQKDFDNNKTINDPNSYDVRDKVNKFMSVDPFDKSIRYPFPVSSILTLISGNFSSWATRGALNLDKQWNVHALNALIGLEYKETTRESVRKTTYGFDEELNQSAILDLIQFYPIRPRGSLQIDVNGGRPRFSGNISRFGSYYGNATYIYQGRYLLTGSARMDQSNAFGVKANQRRTPLWSSGVAWVLSKEDFFNLKGINNVKFRASYGYSGNINPGSSAFTTILHQTGGNYFVPNGANFATILSPANAQLRWEKIRMLNFGLDFSVLNSRINGSVEYYRKRGLDLFGPIIVDPTTGVNGYTGNQASMKGKGIDLHLNVKVIDQQFKWNSTFNLSYNTDEITDYGDQKNITGSYLIGGAVFVGRPRNSIFSYRFAGLDPENGNPKLSIGNVASNFTEVNNAKIEDVEYHGTFNPLFFGSFLNAFEWKEFSLSFNIAYKFNYYFRRSSIDYNDLFTNWNEHSDYSFRWQKNGDEQFTNIPSLPTAVDTDRNNAYLNSDVLVERGDHVRLQDIRLNYNLSKQFFKQLPFKSLQFYLFVNNPGILWRSNKKGIDPDAYIFGSTPAPRTYAAGITANF